MTGFKLQYYPESEVLLQEAKPFTDWKNAANLADKMLQHMYDWEGCGLAAPQVGISQQVFVLAACGNQYAVFNPKVEYIADAKKPTTEYMDWMGEGCLSIPGLKVNIPRFRTIRVEYQDPDGRECKCEISGFEARVFQHEYDHLRGWLFPFYAIPNSWKKGWKPLLVKPWDYKLLNQLEAYKL